MMRRALNRTPRQRRAGRRYAPVVVPLMLVLLPGCSSVTVLKPTESDQARENVRVLEERVRDLERRNRELESQLSTAVRERGADAEALAALPHPASISIGRLSAVVDDRRTGTADLARIYVVPVDGRGRPVQMTGTMELEVFTLPATGEPTRAGGVTLDPAALRDAFRAGFGGVHYTLEAPLSGDDAPPAWLARVRYRDGLTGAELTAEGVVRALPPVSADR